MPCKPDDLVHEAHRRREATTELFSHLHVHTVAHMTPPHRHDDIHTYDYIHHTCMHMTTHMHTYIHMTTHTCSHAMHIHPNNNNNKIFKINPW